MSFLNKRDLEAKETFTFDWKVLKVLMLANFALGSTHSAGTIAREPHQI